MISNCVWLKGTVVMNKTESTALYKNESNIWSDLNKISEICGFHISVTDFWSTRISADLIWGSYDNYNTEQQNFLLTKKRKVVNNRINSISVDETNVNKVEKELVNFSLSPFTEDNFIQVLWGKIDYLFYNTSWEFDQKMFTPNGIITINGDWMRGFRFRIETENYIDLKHFCKVVYEI